MRSLRLLSLMAVLGGCSLLASHPGTDPYNEQLAYLSARTAGMAGCVTAREMWPERIQNLRSTLDALQPSLDNPTPETLEGVLSTLEHNFALPEGSMVLASWWVRYWAGQQATAETYNIVGIAMAREVVAGCRAAIQNFVPHTSYMPTPELLAFERL